MGLLSTLKRALKLVAHSPAAPVATVLDVQLQVELSREFDRLKSSLRSSMPGNPAGWGFKVYSQADEDGIIEFLCRTLDIACGTCVEIGCGDGRENNSHYLLLKGWRGVWIDGNASNIASIRAALPESERLRVVQAMVTPANVVALIEPAIREFGDIDLLSVDVDSVDLPIARAALTRFRPRIFIGEYNAKFPYPVRVTVSEDSASTWSGDDYQGASLGAWVDALADDYELVCCNLAGTNAFFIRRDCIPAGMTRHAPDQLYQPARFFLTALQSGHRPSLAFLADRLRGERRGT